MNIDITYVDVHFFFYIIFYYYDDFSISPTAATWNWDKYGQSVASSITVTLGDCISNYTIP